MSSRQEEKEARRQARLEQEAAERKAAARKQRLWLVVGALLAAGVIAVAALALTGGGGSGSGDATKASANGVKLPAVKISDEKGAAKAAGCTLANPADEGRGHEQKQFKASDYKTNPPTSGNHFPEWAQDGIYTDKTVPDNVGMLVHTLEHGRIDVQYKPGTDATTVKQLVALLAEQDDGYHMLLYPNTTDMPYQVAATAWDHSLTCPDMNDKVFDAIRAFRDAHIDRGPEKVQ
jgi:hypothetical protein